jgi:hypothetical protein
MIVLHYLNVIHVYIITIMYLEYNLSWNSVTQQRLCDLLKTQKGICENKVRQIIGLDWTFHVSSFCILEQSTITQPSTLTVLRVITYAKIFLILLKMK